jgi:hypothetical protein
MSGLYINSFADSFLTPARSNCQFLCSDDIPKRCPKQKKSIKMRWKTPCSGPLPILAESVRLGFIAVIGSSSTILSERELKSPIAAGSYCPIFVGSLHSTCTREHKNWQFERAGVRKLSAKLFSSWLHSSVSNSVLNFQYRGRYNTGISNCQYRY